MRAAETGFNQAAQRRIREFVPPVAPGAESAALYLRRVPGIRQRSPGIGKRFRKSGRRGAGGKKKRSGQAGRKSNGGFLYYSSPFPGLSDAESPSGGVSFVFFRIFVNQVKNTGTKIVAMKVDISMPPNTPVPID